MPPATANWPMRLQLLGCFRLTVGARVVQLPLQSQRLLAYLAVVARPVARHQLAETL
jgi:DNA-binding SARP family transcriptional activator